MMQSFRDQAERAERLARFINDERTCDALLNYARDAGKAKRVASPFT
jgi:hypothetical protein